ncbi:MAG: hypothetical protein ACUVV4_02415 [Candidatus Bathyarchaeia archaeon]
MAQSVLSIGNGTNTETYSYDMIDRLNKTNGLWGDITFKFYDVGNRIKKTDSSTFGYTYNIINQLTKVGASDDYI